MPEPVRQLTLDLPLDPRFGAEDFLVSPSNQTAYAAVESWPDWPGRLMRLGGPSGSGKSHLASIWAQRARAVTVSARAISARSLPSLAAAGAIVIEDVDRGPVEEHSVFHLLNLARERAVFALFTGATGIEGWSLAIPDLVSRLRLAPAIELGPPDDALLRAVLVKLFADRQLAVESSVVAFVAARIERSLARAASVVADLDREALSRGRRVTRQIAAMVLAQDEDADDDDD